jgi:VWFA-related protein
MAPRLSRLRPLALGAAVVALTLTTLAASQAPKPKPQDPATQKPAGQSGQAAPAPDGQAQGDQAQAAQPTFRANINLVRVDVIVTDKKGMPVDTLKQADFQVFEDGKPQDIETFKLFKIDAITSTTPARPIRTSFDEESEAQRDDVRLFAFFLDDYHVRRGNAMRARKMADSSRAGSPVDMVSIMPRCSQTDTVVMSRDHENLAKALEQFDGVTVPRRETSSRTIPTTWRRSSSRLQRCVHLGDQGLIISWAACARAQGAGPVSEGTTTCRRDAAPEREMGGTE